MDDFDFEDDLDDLKRDINQSPGSFFPPVNNNNSSKLIIDKDNSRKSVFRNNESKALPQANSGMNQYQEPTYPKATNKFNLDSPQDDDDDFGLEEVKPKAQMNLISPPKNTNNNLPTMNDIDKKSDNDDDYGGDFGDLDDSNGYKPTIRGNKPPVPQVNQFPSPGFSKDIDTKARPKVDSIKLNDMKRLNSKLDKSSDFDDYNDNLSNLNKPVTPKKYVQPKRNPVKPPSLANKLPSPRSNVIQSNDKPVTMRTGPVADPVPEKQNYRLDTEQKKRYVAKDTQKSKDDEPVSDESSDGGEDRDDNVFMTQPIQNEEPEPAKKFQVPEQKPEKPKVKETSKSIVGYADEDTSMLDRENESLISQLLQFTSQMDDRMILLKKSKKVDKQLEDRPNSAIQSRKHKLDAMSRKTKLIRSDIENMNRILDNSYKVDSVVDKENLNKEQEMILQEQTLKLKDGRKVIREQKKFFKEMDQMEGIDGKSPKSNF